MLTPASFTLPRLSLTPSSRTEIVITERTPSSPIIELKPEEKEQLPTYLIQANQLLQNHLAVLEAKEIEFLKAYAQEDKDFFTNAALQKQIEMKEGEVSELKALVQKEKVKISAKIVANLTVWKAENENQFRELQVKLEKKRQAFIGDLLAWEEKLDKDYRLALDRFNNEVKVYKLLEDNKNKQLEKLEKAREEFGKLLQITHNLTPEQRATFTKQFGDVAQIHERKFGRDTVPDINDITLKLPKKPVPPNKYVRCIPQRKDLANKSIVELDQIAQQQAEGAVIKNVKTNIEAYEKAELQIIKANMEKLVDKMQDLQGDDGAKYRILLNKLDIAILKYNSTAEQFKIASRDAYLERKNECKKIHEDIEAAKKRLATVYDEYCTLRDKYIANNKQESDAECHVRVDKFAALKSLLETIKKEREGFNDQSLDQHWESRVATYIRAYDENDKKYFCLNADESHLELKLNFSDKKPERENVTSAKFLRLEIKQYKTEFETADKLVEASREALEKDAYNLNLRETITLLTKVIKNNLDFWHDQIDSFWGSGYKVDKIKVPHGIMLMAATLDNKDKSNEEKLGDILNIARDRNKAGLGFFAKRAVGTTGAFYTMLVDHMQNKFGESAGRKVRVGLNIDLTKIEEKLKLMTDKNNSKLVLDTTIAMSRQRAREVTRPLRK